MRPAAKGTGRPSTRRLPEWVPSRTVSADRTPYRLLAFVAAATLLGAFLSVLYRVVQISGDPTVLLALAAVSAGVATALAGVLRVKTAVVGAVLSVVGGLLFYLGSLPYEPLFVEMIQSNLELLSGRSILRIEQADVWALSITPGPVFATWYLTIRGWYGAGAIAGFAGVGYFVLTGDAGVTTTLLAVLAAVALVGFGDLSNRGGSIEAAEVLAVVLAIMVVAPLAVSVVPGGSATPLSFDAGTGGGGGEGATIEASLVSTGPEVDIVGSIELSSASRFTIESESAHYWRVASYDRYAGDGWIRTGSPLAYPDRNLSTPEGPTRLVEQSVTAESEIGTMPAAWRPVALANASETNPQVTTGGSLVPGTRLEEGDSYEVVSAVPAAGPDNLTRATGDDPSDLATKYTQLPTTTADRIAERTAEITSDATTRYEAAVAVESWLLDNREYSLTVDKPDGNVAEAFLFEMERGYCVYYATTMAVMLRSQDIPARMTVGYTAGERIENETYRVRGYNSHAWVEVYFPDHGWVAFDPTPQGPRRAAEQAQVGEEGESLEPGTAVDGDPNRPTPAPGTPNATLLRDSAAPTDDPTEETQTDDDEAFTLPSLPSREQIAVGAIVFVGALAGVRRASLWQRVYRSIWLRWQPRSDPETDVERAFRRLAYVLERRHRPRRPGETAREYLDAIDASPAARRVAAIRERARYGLGVTETDADDAVDLVEQVRTGNGDLSSGTDRIPDSV